MMEKIRKHIEEELATADRNAKKAVRIFVRTLREADMITQEQKRELLDYIDSRWAIVAPTADKAMEAWQELAFLNGKTDAAVNDLLEKVAGAKYKDSAYDSDPIYHTIQELSFEERRRFLAGCDRIRATA